MPPFLFFSFPFVQLRLLFYYTLIHFVLYISYVNNSLRQDNNWIVFQTNTSCNRSTRSVGSATENGVCHLPLCIQQRTECDEIVCERDELLHECDALLLQVQTIHGNESPNRHVMVTDIQNCDMDQKGRNFCNSIEKVVDRVINAKLEPLLCKIQHLKNGRLLTDASNAAPGPISVATLASGHSAPSQRRATTNKKITHSPISNPQRRYHSYAQATLRDPRPFSNTTSSLPHNHSLDSVKVTISMYL